MRSRGDNGTQVFTADTMADQFGVNKGSYDPVKLPELSFCKVQASLSWHIDFSLRASHSSRLFATHEACAT